MCCWLRFILFAFLVVVIQVGGLFLVLFITWKTLWLFLMQQYWDYVLLSFLWFKEEFCLVAGVARATCICRFGFHGLTFQKSPKSGLVDSFLVYGSFRIFENLKVFKKCLS